MVTYGLEISSIGVPVVEVFASRLLLIGYGSVSLLGLATRDLDTQVQVMTFRVDPRKLPNLLLVLFS